MATRTWVDGAAGGTPLNANNLNGIETDITTALGVPDAALKARIADQTTQTAAQLNATYAAKAGIRINAANNPNVETNLAGWVNRANTNIALSTVSPIAGTQSVLVTSVAVGTTGCSFEASNGVDAAAALTVLQSTPYSFSLAMQSVDSVASVSLVVDWFTAAGGYISSTTGATVSMVQGTVYRPSVSGPSPATGGKASLYVYLSGYAASGNTFRADSVLIEQSSVPGTYFDGNTAATPAAFCAWSGPANASMSYRLAVS